MAVRVEAGAEPIPGYTLIERIGGGGFGEVWKAEAPGGLLKAIKVVYGDLQTTDPDGTRRAEQELKALKRVQTVRHPYLLSLERYDIIDNRLLIVMELAECNMWDRFRDCKAQNLQGIPRDELMRYMEESAEVLDLMNNQYGLQHLDIKPQNLFLVHQHAKVADFGLVKDLQGKMATVTGGITPVYASPETFDGVVSRFCDQYSLAIVYQELLTGQRPFAGTSLQQLIMQHLTAQPNLAPLPKHDRTAIGKSLAKKPDDRFPTCMEMVKALRAAEQAAVMVAVPAAVPKAAPVPAPAPSPTPARPAAAPPTAAPPRQAEPRPRSADTPVSPETPRAERPRPESKPEPVVIAESVPSEKIQPARQAPPEVTGTGPLMPTVLIGLGQKGLEVLSQLRESLQDRFGSLDQVPHLRLIYIDTDADAYHAATHGGPGPTVSAQDAILARLNRPSHYLKPATGRISIGPWFNSKLLYRIPRNPTTTGLRPLGRLAFVDNYRLIAGKLRADLEAVTRSDALAAANRNTRLGIRTNRPRVHIISSLAGGTGSGMFIDLAYVARSIFKQLGYKPDVIGNLFIPRADKPGKDMLATANVYGALTELQHFSSPDTLFAAAYDDRDGKIKDKDAPLRQINLVLLEPDNESRRTGESTRLMGDLLGRELMTPLGRSVDEARDGIPAEDGKPRPTPYYTLGVYRITWPRRLLVQQAARQLCRQLAEGWGSKESASLREPVQKWLAEEVSKEEIGADTVIAHLKAASKEALEESPETVIAELVGPYQAQQGRRAPEPEPQDVLDTLAQMEEVFGGPDETMTARANPLAEALDQAVDSLVKNWSKKFARLTMELIDKPQFRLGGAEEAIRQLSQMIGQWLERYETMLHEAPAMAAKAHEQIHQLVAALEETRGTRRAAAVVANLAEFLPLYPKYRYQSLVFRRVANVFTSLRGQLSDLIREANFCRLRLNELVKIFEQAAQVDVTQVLTAPALYLLPAGSTSIDESVHQFLDQLNGDEIEELDTKIQEIIGQQFQSLKEVCLGSANQVRSLEQQMLLQAETFVNGRVASSNVVEMFLTRYGPSGDADKMLTESFEDATPKMAKYASETETRVLALPPGASAELLRTNLLRALPDEKLSMIDSPDDVVFYRERHIQDLAKIPQLGNPAEDAYRQIGDSDPLTPHSRIDITEWLPLRKEPE